MKLYRMIDSKQNLLELYRMIHSMQNLLAKNIYVINFRNNPENSAFISCAITSRFGFEMLFSEQIDLVISTENEVMELC